MHRIDVSVYQFSVQGLYSPRQSGFFGYVATTFVIVGVSIERSSFNISSTDWAMVGLPLRLRVRVAPRIAPHNRPLQRSPGPLAVDFVRLEVLQVDLHTEAG